MPHYVQVSFTCGNCTLERVKLKEKLPPTVDKRGFGPGHELWEQVMGLIIARHQELNSKCQLDERRLEIYLT
jgi:hypothetical protein